MKSWTLTRNNSDYSVAYPGDPYVAYANGWNTGGMAASDWLRVDMTYADADAPPEMRVTGELTRGSGLPKAAPTMIIGAHYNLESRVNPLSTDGRRGLNTATIESMRVSVDGEKNTAVNGEYFRAIQLYATYEQFTGSDWAGYKGKFFDIQIRLDTVNYKGGADSYEANDVRIGSHRFDVSYGPNGFINGNAIHYLFVLEDPAAGVDNLDLDALLEFVRVTNNAAAGRNDAGLWLYQVSSWIEPIAGRIDATFSAPVLELNGKAYGGAIAAPSPAPQPAPAPAPSPSPSPSPAPTIDLVVSDVANRASPYDLAGATLDGRAFVFVEGTRTATKVEFFLDDPGMTRAPVQVEKIWHHDFAGTAGSLANAWDTRALADGVHTITARATFADGRVQTVTDRFTIDNVPDGPAGGAQGHVVTVRAAGTGRASATLDDAPRFEILVDGVSRGVFRIDNPVRSYTGADTLYRDYTVRWTGDAADEVTLRFFNDGLASDGTDKNLYVDRLTVNGARFEAETDALYYVQGRAPAATEGMWWNGRMVFDDLAA